MNQEHKQFPWKKIQGFIVWIIFCTMACGITYLYARLQDEMERGFISKKIEAGEAFDLRITSSGGNK